MSFFWYETEEHILVPFAQLAKNSKGRLRPDDDSEYRTCYQRDRDRIIHSKAFRRLKTKTQVFIKPYDDHFRTRLTHTLEVMQISRSIARALRLNEDLTEAIALGHDLGHTPFGHAGERTLAGIMGHFRHNEQSLRVVDVLEKEGRGLNLSFEVRDGILNHCGGTHPQTLEGQIVQLSDRIAYVNHDIDDSIRAGVLMAAELPKSALQVLGETGRERINTLVCSAIENSADYASIRLGTEAAKAMQELREFLFAKVYRSTTANILEAGLNKNLTALFEYYLAHPGEIPEFILTAAGGDLKLAVCDYIAGMTDDFALRLFDSLGIRK
jgi:dGTPase